MGLTDFLEGQWGLDGLCKEFVKNLTVLYIQVFSEEYLNILKFNPKFST